MPAGMRVLLPGRARDADVATSAPASVAPAAPEPTASVHVVHAGDTLWNIAQRRHVRLADLLRWNRLGRDATLHLGQRLRLRDTETAETGAVGAVGAR
jgi:LysM repeat protein